MLFACNVADASTTATDPMLLHEHGRHLEDELVNRARNVDRRVVHLDDQGRLIDSID